MKFAKWITIASIFSLCGCIAAPQPAPAPVPAVSAANPPQQRAIVPAIRVSPSDDPKNRVFSLMACARGHELSCVQVGAWLIAQRESGRRLSVCLHAKGPPEDIDHCTDIDASWPGEEPPPKPKPEPKTKSGE